MPLFHDSPAQLRLSIPALRTRHRRPQCTAAVAAAAAAAAGHPQRRLHPSNTCFLLWVDIIMFTLPRQNRSPGLIPPAGAQCCRRFVTFSRLQIGGERRWARRNFSFRALSRMSEETGLGLLGILLMAGIRVLRGGRGTLRRRIESGRLAREKLLPRKLEPSV